MQVPFNDLYSQYLANKEGYDSAINGVIKRGAFISGSYADAFERSFEKHYGINNCVGVANGTDAIYIALKTLGVTSNDEVITTAHSWFSTSEAIGQIGATPIFVDVDEFFTIDTSKIEEKITSKTKAIIPVHLYGHPANMNEIMKIANKYNLYVVEDCAQAHYAEENGIRIGTFGDIGTFSFYPGKNLGAYGDAGAIITNNFDLAQNCRMYANHGALKKHEHKIEGINSRLDGIQAAILSEKLKFIDSWTKSRNSVAHMYNQLLDKCEFVEIPKVRKDCVHVYHLYVILAKHRDELKSYLSLKGIETAIHYPKALPFLKPYENRNFKPDHFPRAYYNQSKILSLPIFPEMSNDQIAFVCDSILEFYQNKENEK